MADCYFFSPTGTGRALAQRLTGGTGVDLTTPAGRASAPPPKGALTLIFPVYAHRVPGPLAMWLKRLPRGPGTACVLAVYGSAGPGLALTQAARLLRARGRTVVAGAELPGPHCYDMAPGVPQVERHWTGVEAFYAQALARFTGPAAPVRLPGGFDSAVLLPQGLLARLTAPPPRAEQDKCNQCNICKAKCPVGAIPDRMGRCLRCAACVRACPSGARQLRFYSRMPERYISRHMEPSKAPCFYL